MNPAFGRTNQAFPDCWVSLLPPRNPVELEPMANAVVSLGCPIDISSQPGLWGQLLRGANPPVVAFGGREIERSASYEHASDLIQSNLIELLSSLGRLLLDFYFLQIGSAVAEFQIAGALEALEAARHDGHIRFIGIAATGNTQGARTTWQFHDAFEAVALRWDSSTQDPGGLVSLANERRAGILTLGGSRSERYGQCALIPVRSVTEASALDGASV